LKIKLEFSNNRYYLTEEEIRNYILNFLLENNINFYSKTNDEIKLSININYPSSVQITIGGSAIKENSYKIWGDRMYFYSPFKKEYIVEKIDEFLYDYIEFYTGYTSGNYFKSIIVNNFDGFDKNKIFELENGQVWIQKNFKFRVLVRVRPVAVIFFEKGKYKLRLEDEGDDESVIVERIR